MDDEKRRVQAGPVITITRAPGCGGERIARALAEGLGLTLYDGKLVEEIARDAHVSAQVVGTLDEKGRSQLDDWLSGFSGGAALSPDHYIRCLRSTLFAVAAHGSAVIVGRGANFVLPAKSKAFGLCLVAPLDVRVQDVMREFRLTQEAARRQIARTERDRRSLVRKLADADVADATHYHMVINTALVSLESILQIARAIIRPRPAGGPGAAECTTRS